MPKYRIVKMKHEHDRYKVQKRVFFIWFDQESNSSLNWCESYVLRVLEEEKLKKENPKDIVVRTYYKSNIKRKGKWLTMD